MSAAPPRIFSSQRRLAARARMARLRGRGGAVSTLARELAVDATDRLAFLDERFESALVIGDATGAVAAHLRAQGAAVSAADPSPLLAPLAIDEEQPLPGGPYGLVASLGLLDTVNDLPGALIHLRNALRPGGLMIASFVGAGSLPRLRAAMLAAEAERPAARIHPQVDVRGAGQLVNRLGFSGPVVDGWSFEVRFESFDQLVSDLRAQALGNVLASARPPLTREALAAARAAFAAGADADGRVAERFEIVTVSARR